MNKLIFIGLASVLMTACNPSTQNQTEMTTKEKKTGMVEITTFKLNQGVTEKDFGKSALAMQKEFLEKQSGFIKRTLTVSQDNVWTDIVYWRDQQSFETTMKLAETSEPVLPFWRK
ncbi:hypothetical protein [Aquiflexum lacus]|uniref:hypothetical protein n=1 Tax=Aquiflexum lacus TaxID=2483805 RepID=UPI0018943226|nr:hypothetical protein [Aquiflexum lacus]